MGWKGVGQSFCVAQELDLFDMDGKVGIILIFQGIERSEGEQANKDETNNDTQKQSFGLGPNDGGELFVGFVLR